MGGISLNSRMGLAFIALVIASVLFAFSRMPGGIGGTGVTGTPGGIGGTGIYGRIDAFGSIWVNGVEIFYDVDQNIVRQGRDGLPERLAIGQMVAVTLDEVDGRAEARTIEIVEEVSGPVTTANAEQIEILGQLVLLTEDTIVDLPEGRFVGVGNLAIGGYRTTDGEIIASHISAPLVADEVTLRGKIDRIESDAFWIGEQRIVEQGHRLIVGEHVEISGVVNLMDNGETEIIADQVRERAAIPFREVPKIMHFQYLVNHDGYYSELSGIEDDIPVRMDDNVREIRQVAIRTMEADVREGVTTLREVRNDIIQAREIRATAASAIIEARRQAIAERIENRVSEVERPQTPVVERPRVIENRRVAVEPRENLQPDIPEVATPNPVQEAIENQRAEVEERRNLDLEQRRQILEEQRRRARIEARRKQLHKMWLDAANQRRLLAVEARRQVIQEARREALSNGLPEREEVFTPQEFEELVRDGDLSREALREIQRNIRDRVQGEIRAGARMEARQEIRKRVREEIRRRIRRQLREQ